MPLWSLIAVHSKNPLGQNEQLIYAPLFLTVGLGGRNRPQDEPPIDDILD